MELSGKCGEREEDGKRKRDPLVPVRVNQKCQPKEAKANKNKGKGGPDWKKIGGWSQGSLIILEDGQDIKRGKEMGKLNRLWSSSCQQTPGKV